jgi:hypothetical protein
MVDFMRFARIKVPASTSSPYIQAMTKKLNSQPVFFLHSKVY